MRSTALDPGKLDGADRDRCAGALAALRRALVDEITSRANEWAKLT